jgi:hypothetical protein
MISFIVYILYIESEFSLELKGIFYISLMDKQLLDALGNLSDALEIMAGYFKIRREKNQIQPLPIRCEW